MSRIVNDTNWGAISGVSLSKFIKHDKIVDVGFEVIGIEISDDIKEPLKKNNKGNITCNNFLIAKFNKNTKHHQFLSIWKPILMSVHPDYNELTSTTTEYLSNDITSPLKYTTSKNISCNDFIIAERTSIDNQFRFLKMYREWLNQPQSVINTPPMLSPLQNLPMINHTLTPRSISSSNSLRVKGITELINSNNDNSNVSINIIMNIKVLCMIFKLDCEDQGVLSLIDQLWECCDITNINEEHILTLLEEFLPKVNSIKFSRKTFVLEFNKCLPKILNSLSDSYKLKLDATLKKRVSQIIKIGNILLTLTRLVVNFVG